VGALADVAVFAQPRFDHLRVRLELADSEIGWKGGKPHGGWRDSPEFVPDSVGSIPRSTAGQRRHPRFGGDDRSYPEKYMEGGFTQPPSWITSKGGKVKRVSASLRGNTLKWSTDSQSEQDSVVDGPRPLESALDGLSTNPVTVQLDAVRDASLASSSSALREAEAVRRGGGSKEGGPTQSGSAGDQLDWLSWILCINALSVLTDRSPGLLRGSSVVEIRTM